MRCPYKVAAFIMKLGRNADEISLDAVAECDMENCGKYNSCTNRISEENVAELVVEKPKKVVDELPKESK